MTITIDVPAELERQLESAARAQGVGKAEFVRFILEERFAIAPSRATSGTMMGRITATGLPIRDRSREWAWLTSGESRAYANQYVALDGADVIAAGANIKDVAAQARAAGKPEALISYVEEEAQLREISGGLW